MRRRVVGRRAVLPGLVFLSASLTGVRVGVTRGRPIVTLPLIGRRSLVRLDPRSVSPLVGFDSGLPLREHHWTEQGHAE